MKIGSFETRITRMDENRIRKNYVVKGINHRSKTGKFFNEIPTRMIRIFQDGKVIFMVKVEDGKSNNVLGEVAQEGNTGMINIRKMTT